MHPSLAIALIVAKRAATALAVAGLTTSCNSDDPPATKSATTPPAESGATTSTAVQASIAGAASAPPNLTAFGQRALHTLLERYPGEACRLDLEPYAVTCGRLQFSVEKLFQSIPAGASSGTIDLTILGYFERTRTIAADTGTDVAPPLESVRAHLRPQLLPTEYLQDVRDAVARAFVAGLHIAYVIDQPGHYAFVRRAYLDAWSMSADELDSIAVENLAQAYRGTILTARLLPGVEHGQWATIEVPDGYAAARFLVPQFRRVTRAAVGGDPYFVAFPNRNYLVAWSRSLSRAVTSAFAAHVQQEFRGKPYPLSPTAYLVEGATVRSLPPTIEGR